MTDALLCTDQLVLKYGGLVATNQVSLDVMPGELHAVIGPNGAGKTTLLSLLSGELPPTSGRIRFEQGDITRLRQAERVRTGIARSFQITSVLEESTARDNVAIAVQAHQGHSFRFWRNAYTDPRLLEPSMALLDMVGLKDVADEPVNSLAHGARRQLELAIALATQPKLLLLDEPMAGMSPVESIAMIKLLGQLKRRHTILLVEHDMDAVFALADRISVLVYGRVIASGSPAAIRADSAVQEAYLGAHA